MRTLTIVTTLTALLVGIQSTTPRAFAGQTDKGRGSITGQVKVNDKPAQGISVIATPSITDPTKAVESVLNKSASLKATTDSDGRYKLEDVPAGKYSLAPFAPTLVSSSLAAGSEVTVTDGSTTENVDFSLLPGGVITGKVTDNDGRPVIGERIALKAMDDPTSSVPRSMAMMNAVSGGGRMYSTDDRGVYRIFGLRPGRYLVSTGSDIDMFSALFKFRPKRQQTFYPGVTDEAKAKQVQVTGGSEATGIDIQFNSDRGFAVSGRVSDASRNTPVAHAMIAYSKSRAVKDRSDDDSIPDRVLNENDWTGALPGGFTTTNEQGEFRFESVVSGSYKLEVAPTAALTGGSSEFYSDGINFEVKGANVDKLEVKVHRGASISGVVVVENADGQGGLESFGQVMLGASVVDAQTKSNSSGSGRVTPDGTFRIGGLKAGKATIATFSMNTPRAAILRIERNGVEVHGGIDVQAEEQITGLRVVLVPANCVIRGHVTIQGGALPAGITLSARARPQKGDRRIFADVSQEEVDTNGDFVIENLAPGTYEVEVFSDLPVRQGGRNASAKQIVTAASGRPAEISLVLDLARKDTDK